MNAIKIISLGSREPDNITLRAFNALKESDVVFAPSGEAVRMLERLKPFCDFTTKLEQFDIPMKRDSQSASETYHNVTERLLHLQESGQRASLVTIGDAGIYSSALKVASELIALGANVEVLPGIPSFLAGLAYLKQPLIEQGENLALLSHIQSPVQLTTLLKQGSVVAIMKLSLYQELVKRLLCEEAYEFIYMERLGDDEEFVSTQLKDIVSRHCPYFSMIIIKPKRI